MGLIQVNFSYTFKNKLLDFKKNSKGMGIYLKMFKLLYTLIFPINKQFRNQVGSNFFLKIYCN